MKQKPRCIEVSTRACDREDTCGKEKKKREGRGWEGRMRYVLEGMVESEPVTNLMG